MPVPVMTNQINYKSYVWNLFEIAIYRERLKEENLDLLSSFIEEISIIKEDLMKYVSKVRTMPVSETSFKSESKSSNKFSPQDSLILAPFIGFASILSPLLPNFSFSKSKEKIAKGKEMSSRDMHHHTNELKVVEDTWKMYVVHKKAFAYMQY
ncbi:hypothetical protein EOM09_07030 [bacterium]|nr:hypothetical protein [bacterium]